MAGAPDTSRVPPVSLALCLSSEALDSFGSIIRHLVVGLVDHVSRIYLISSDPRAEKLALGPTQAIIHPEPRWPVARRRIQSIVDAIAGTPPTVVHVVSGHSYPVGLALADEFDADLVMQVTSLDDCADLERYPGIEVGRILCFTEPLSRIVTQQLSWPADQVELIGPGILAAQRPACFARVDRAPSIVCTAPFVKDAGIDLVIKAAQLILDRGRKTMFFLLGQGPLESTFRKLARERGVMSMVTFAHPSGDCFDAASNADIFLHPAPWKSMYIDALQAMGHGLAVAAVPDTTADFLIPGETARISQGNRAADLAGAIEDLLADRPAAQRLAAQGLDYVRRKHSMSAMADKTAAVYRRLLLARSTFALRE